MGAFDFFAQIAQYGANEKARVYNADELERAARMADAQAVDAVARGSLLAGMYRQKGSQLAGKQRVADAASGVDTNSGTAAQVQNFTRIMSELDAQTMLNNARREALGHKEVGRKYRSQRDQLAQESENEKTGLVLGSLSYLTSAAGGALKAGG